MGLTIGPLHVRRAIFINAKPQTVWQEFESFERIQKWLDIGHTLHTFEPRVGGPVRLSADINGDQRHFGGSILVYEPGSEVSFTSQWDEPHNWPVPTVWTIRLTPLYDGTLVELFHHGFERLGAHVADEFQDYESAWDIKHLKALRAVVEG